MAMVGRNVSQLEESVTTAEKMFGSNPISRALKGFSRPSFLSGVGFSVCTLFRCCVFVYFALNCKFWD